MSVPLEIVVMRGLPGSGKTTRVREHYHYPRVSRDDLRRMMYGPASEYYAEDPDLIRHREERITEVETAIVERLLRGGAPVVVDDCHAAQVHVQVWHDLAAQLLGQGVDVEVVVDDTCLQEVDVETCIARQAARGPDERVPAEVIRRMGRQAGVLPPERTIELSGEREHVRESAHELVHRLRDEHGEDQIGDLILAWQAAALLSDEQVAVAGRRTWQEPYEAGVEVTLALDTDDPQWQSWAALVRYVVREDDDGRIYVTARSGELLVPGEDGTITQYLGVCIAQALEGPLWSRWGRMGWRAAYVGDNPDYGPKPRGVLVDMLGQYRAAVTAA